ncbi:MAG TPA: DUF3429 domain-containing protein [Burkholderiaceae bacterium]|nr:DUF3429 domain-containing protein [Burkholderiaceae bacterium]
MNTPLSTHLTTRTADTRPSATVWLLGLGGLIPFVAAALWTYTTDDATSAQKALVIQHAYAACILSFVGALHWAGAPQSGSDSSSAFSPAPAWRLIWGVLPSLVAWSAWMMPTEAARGLCLAGGLAAAWVFDWLTYRQWGWPRAFMYLRTLLTAVAAASLVVTAIR